VAGEGEAGGLEEGRNVDVGSKVCM
jgi:hypothetical protein